MRSPRSLFLGGIGLIGISISALTAVWIRYKHLRSEDDACTAKGNKHSLLSTFHTIEILYGVCVALLPAALASDFWQTADDIVRCGGYSYGSIDSGSVAWSVGMVVMTAAMSLVWTLTAFYLHCFVCCMRLSDAQVATTWAAVGALPWLIVFCLLIWQGIRWFARLAYNSFTYA